MLRWLRDGLKLTLLLRLTRFSFSFSINESNTSDGHTLGPTEIYSYLSNIMYARRSKMNPIWNTLLVGGVRNGERSVDSFLPRRDASSRSIELTLRVRVLLRCLKVLGIRGSDRNDLHFFNTGDGIRSLHVSFETLSFPSSSPSRRTFLSTRQDPPLSPVLPRRPF